jgi:hypothetical protein
MGTIIPRRRADGSTAYLAQILKKKDGRIVHRESRTFDRQALAKAWVKKREADIAAPGGLERAQTPKGTLGDAIDKYIAMSRKEIGKTKTQVLRSIKTYSIADMDCADIKSTDIIALAEELSVGRKPQTVGNYISHLSAIFRLARSAWRLPLDYQAMRDAHAVLSNMGITSKSAKRDRRPTLAELDLLMQHLVEIHARAPLSTPDAPDRVVRPVLDKAAGRNHADRMGVAG